jgi:hypothetical protein
MAKNEDNRKPSLESFRPTAPIHIKPPLDITPVDIGGGSIIVPQKPQDKEPERKYSAD